MPKKAITLGLAALFTDGPPSNGSGPSPKSVDTFILMDDLQIPDEKAAKRYADAIEARHPKLDLRFMGSVGVLPYKYGVWAIELWKTKERLRFCDNLQLRELYEALGDESSDRFWKLVNDAENLPGPYREGRPPLNGKGQPAEETANVGNFGPLRDECEWIENTDKALIQYRGTDEIWPTGCWQIEKAGYETQYLDAAGIKYVAHTILKMPADGTQAREQRRAHMAQVLAARKKSPGSGMARLFADESEIYSNELPGGDGPFVSEGLTEPTKLKRGGKRPALASLLDDGKQSAGLGSLFAD